MPEDIMIKFASQPEVNTKVDISDGVDHAITFTSSDPEVAEVDKNGNITVNSRGVATITVTVTDEFGNKVSDTCKVDTRMKWWELLMRYIADCRNEMKVKK